MSEKRDPLIYIDDILSSIDLIFQYTKDQTEKSLERADLKLKDAILLRFEIIGEAALQIPETFKKTYPYIPWRDMVDMRNKIIHEYFGWNWYIIWKTIRKDLPELKKQLEQIIKHV